MVRPAQFHSRPEGNCPCVALRSEPRMSILANGLRGQHAYFIGSLGVRFIPGLADRVVVGNSADQTQASAAGDGPSDSDLVSPDGVRRVPVNISGGDQTLAESQSPRSARWLVGVDGGTRTGRQLRAVPDGPEPA